MDPSSPEITPNDEIDQHRHPVLPESEHYHLIRARYDIRYDGSDSSITLDLQQNNTGERRRLVFDAVVIHRLLGEPYGIYIMDIRYRDGEFGVEVGEYYEEGGVFFYASDARDVAHQPDGAGD